MQTEVKTPVKSEEQKVTEMAISQFVSIMQSVYGKNAEVKVTISGVPLSKLGSMAECQSWVIENRIDMLDNIEHYIRKPFSGKGYSIEEISE